MPRKRKKHVDPNAPKRPSSAYMMFMVEVRQTIIEKNNFKPSDIASIGKELGYQWKNLGPIERNPYERRAQIDYARYCNARKKYEAEKSLIGNAKKAASTSATTAATKTTTNTSTSTSGGKSTSFAVSLKSTKRGDLSIPLNGKNKYKKHKEKKAALKKTKKKKQKRKREGSEVRKPMTSYLCFCRVARPHLIVHFENDTFANMGKKLGLAWKSLTMEDKYPFYAAAEADRLRYLKECREVNQDPMYSPSLAGLSVERWESYVKGKDIQC